MKIITKQILVCVPIIVLVLAINSPAAAKTPFEGQGELQRDIAWLYDSPLTVFEEITDLGGGLYEYYYSFENVDDKHIWAFAVCTTFEILSSETTWDQHITWLNSVKNDLDDFLGTPYDPRNLNPALIAWSATFDDNFFGNPGYIIPIDPGEYVQGFTFVADTYDNSSKLYFYETMEDGYAGNTGYLAAIGYTQPSSVATESGTWGGIKSLYR